MSRPDIDTTTSAWVDMATLERLDPRTDSTTQMLLDNLVLEEMESDFGCELRSPACTNIPVLYWVFCKACGETLRGCEGCKKLTDIIRAETRADDFNCRKCQFHGKRWDDVWQLILIRNMGAPIAGGHTHE